MRSVSYHFTDKQHILPNNIRNKIFARNEFILYEFDNDKTNIKLVHLK